MGDIKFIIETKVNPSDEWKKYKQFKKFDRAFQSFTMLQKHRPNILKEGDYCQYRLYDVVNKNFVAITDTNI